MKNLRQGAWLAWSAVGLLAVLCGVLALLQYRWIGEITDAERSRLREALQSRLNVLARNLNDEVATAAIGLVPHDAAIQQLGRERAYSAQYLEWRNSHDPWFSRIALAIPADGGVSLLKLDMNTGEFAPADWPAEWNSLRERYAEGVRGPPPQEMPLVIEIPRFRPPAEGEPLRAQEWLLLELNANYVRTTLLPLYLSRYLGESGKLEYDAEVTPADDPSKVIYDSIPELHHGAAKPDAIVGLLDVRMAGFGGRRGGRGRGGEPFRRERPGRPGAETSSPMPGGPTRWTMMVWHRAGSLDALVAATRRRNLAISAGILVLILATVAALMHFSRQAHRLAELQMNFVAGVSHELRTPLTVIRTAAFNLRGKLAGRPEQVEKYGALIQAESEKLTLLVEQVLRFAGVQAGHIIRGREPVEVEKLVDEAVRASRVTAGNSGVTVEKQLDPELPAVLADELALRHALQNLLDNALKYGTEGSNWIRVSAAAVKGSGGPAVEFRVADHGAGIPLDEQQHIFDPFFRGRRALQDQVHGTGLGLNLVKRIVEAHGGTIRVESEPMKGTEFIVRIPASAPEFKDEFAHSAG
jgi:signal transduction histidine kinase